MEAIDLEKLFSDATEDELSRLPSSHPLRTPDCPPTPRFYKGVRGGWSHAPLHSIVLGLKQTWLACRLSDRDGMKLGISR